MDEYIFQVRLAHGNRFNLPGKGFDYLGDEAMSLFLFQAQLAAYDLRRHAKAGEQLLCQKFGLAAGFQQQHVAADFLLEFRRSA